MKYDYDLFLSHNKFDKPWTEKLATDIESIGKGALRVFLDKWDIQPGGDIVQEIERGLKTSRFIGLVMSPEAFASEWVALERSTAMYRDLAARNKVLIPILRRSCEIPDTLRRLKYIDFKQDDKYDESLQILLCVLKGTTLPRYSASSLSEIDSQQDQILLRQYFTVFRRPAFQIMCFSEFSTKELLDSIDDTQAALNTGKLYSRNGNLLGEYPLVTQFKTDIYKKSFKRITELLYKLKSCVYILLFNYDIVKPINDMKEYINLALNDHGSPIYDFAQYIRYFKMRYYNKRQKVEEVINIMSDIDDVRNEILIILNSLIVDKSEHFTLIKSSRDYLIRFCELNVR